MKRVFDFEKEEKESMNDLEPEQLLDDSWIQEFQEYNKFYLDDVCVLRIVCVYMDVEKNITNIKKEQIMMKNVNQLSKEEMVELLKKNSLQNKKIYKIKGILKYNIDLEPSSVEAFLKSSSLPSFLSHLQHIQDIPFQPTINMFQDMNDLFFFYLENPQQEKSEMQQEHSTTKKVVLRARKTRRSMHMKRQL
jgi:hypothetical protein